MYIRTYFDNEFEDDEAVINEVALELVGGVNGTVVRNNAERYISVAASFREIKIALKIIQKHLRK